MGNWSDPEGNMYLGPCEAVAMSAARLPCLQAAVEFVAWASLLSVQQVLYQTTGFEPAI